MKSAGTHTLAALQSSQFFKAELFEIDLLSGVILRFTDYDLPLTVGANTFSANVSVKRGTVSQKVGISVDTLTLDLAPQGDAPSAFTISGLAVTQAVRLGMFDGARVKMYKVFMQAQSGGMLPTNTNNESVLWWVGSVAEADASRFGIHISAASDLQVLNIQMPRNLIQTGCTHNLFDSGCTLVKASYTTSGTVSSTGPNSAASFTTNLTAANNYHALGVIAFTSGANAGFSRTVKGYLNTNGAVTLIGPLPNPPATGDAFSIYPGCDKTLATCQGKFASNNQAHFRGAPWVPVPETLYDGGTVAGPAPTIGRQGSPGTGSPGPGKQPGIYHP